MNAAPVLQMRLVGEPAIRHGDAWDSIRPRKAFQLLFLVAMSPGKTLDRVEAARRLWPHMEESGQADSLRPCLTRLKGELERMGYGEIVKTTSATISLIAEVETDLDAVLYATLPETINSDFNELLKPVLAGWEAYVANPFKSELELALAARVERLMLDDPERPETWQNVAEQFLQVHPLNVKVTSLLAALLKFNGFPQLANDAIDRFELQWIDEMGRQNMPNIVDLANRILQETDLADRMALSPTRRRFPFLATAIALVLYLILVVSFSGLGSASSRVPQVSVDQSGHLIVLPHGDRPITEQERALVIDHGRR